MIADIQGRLALFPIGTRIDERGLWLGDCRATALTQEFGTPLYVFDEGTLRARCRFFRKGLARYYPGQWQVAYASKAYLNSALAQLFDQEEMGLDVVSGGELYVARQAGFPAERIHFHGNNKSLAELEMALDEGVGRFVIDGFYDLDLLARLAAERRIKVPIWLRISPGVDVHTHHYRKTGLLDSKFGLPLATGDARAALELALNSAHLEPVGLHAHIGSQILDADPFVETAVRLLDFAADARDALGFELRELSPGGGLGVGYHQDSAPVSPEAYLQAVCQAVVEGCQHYSLPLPELTIEPGRSIVAPAGVALYCVGARKEITGVRTYISVDGGMGDNIRPALYGAHYTALVANKAQQPAKETVTIAGKFCESGDVLIRDIALPKLAPGDLLAVPMAGAYGLPLASNYNLSTRPAVVLVSQGRSKLLQRRENHSDLTARDQPLPDW